LIEDLGAKPGITPQFKELEKMEYFLPIFMQAVQDRNREWLVSSADFRHIPYLPLLCNPKNSRNFPV